jgi:5'-nucleotidase
VAPLKRLHAWSSFAILLVLAFGVPGCASSGGGSAPTVTFKLIALNDFHGQLRPPGSATRIVSSQGSQQGTVNLPTGGAVYLASVVQQLKAKNRLSAVVAAGDLIGASPLDSALFHDEPTIEVLNEIGLEFSSVGNHEFDEGIDELRRMQNGGCHSSSPAEESCRRGRFAGARFPYLAANVLDATTGKPVFPASALKTFPLPSGRSMNVGFIGAVVRETPDLVAASGVRNLRFIDEAEAANAAVSALRRQGAQVIVLLIHEGGRTGQQVFDDTSCPGFNGGLLPILDRLDPAISVVISGHTHTTYVCRRGGRLITSAGSHGRFVTDIDVEVEARSGRVVASTARQVAVVNDLAPNPLPERYPTAQRSEPIQQLVSFYVSAAAPLTDRAVASISSDITRESTQAGESALGDLIADAQLAATSGPAEGGAQMAFMNREGIRADLLARTGRITYGEIYATHPFGNALITLTLTGAQIRELLEQQWVGGTILQVSEGFSYEWIAQAAVGSKVDPGSIRLHGAAVDPQKHYRVTVNEFLAGGGDGFKVLMGGTDRQRGVLDVEALEKFLVASSPVGSPPRNRIRRR